MRDNLRIDQLREILAACPEYEAGHHLGRPFMSAYQIAIQFAEAHPDHCLVQSGLPLGGGNSGTNQSVAQRIAWVLSRAIRDGTAGDIEGGFLSHDNIEELCFNYQGERIRVSTLDSRHGHSIFRIRPTGEDRPA